MKEKFLRIKTLKTPFIKYGFFTRNGGYSKNSLASLNCNFAKGDTIKNVNNNIKKAVKELDLSKKKLILIKQTHSNKIIKIDKKNIYHKHIGDGLVTSLSNVALGILTADCAPIFLFNKEKKFICCLHSGWQGTLSNIAKKAIKFFNKNNIKNSEIIAIIGPCLSSRNFEVELDFKKKFLKKNPKYESFFKYKNKSKEYFNMRGLINFQFHELGLKHLYNLNKDTYANDSIFYSYRRCVHLNKNTGGRMINIISFT